MRISYFISSHGFGHATRAAAVMNAIHTQRSNIQFDIFTEIPRWLFENSLPAESFRHHLLRTDVGLVQSNSLHEDVPATIQRLAQFLPFDPAHVERLAGQLVEANSKLVLCDISPLGLAVAQAAGLPSILVENFTWDWIYAGYDGAFKPQLAPFISELNAHFARADYHIQTQPVCRPSPNASLTTAPVSRAPKTPARQVRRQLGLRETDKIVLLTMGGAGTDYEFLEEAQPPEGVYFVVAGGELRRRERLIALPPNSPLFHPDLINAADTVIGKVGYSTLAEVYRAGAPFGYVARPHFRESAALVAFIEQNMPCQAISEAQLRSGAWLSLLPALLALPKRPPAAPNGAEQIATFVRDLR